MQGRLPDQRLAVVFRTVGNLCLTMLQRAKNVHCSEDMLKISMIRLAVVCRAEGAFCGEFQYCSNATPYVPAPLRLRLVKKDIVL